MQKQQEQHFAFSPMDCGYHEQITHEGVMFVGQVKRSGLSPIQISSMPPIQK